MRYVILSVLAAFLALTAAPVYSCWEGGTGEALCIEVVPESGSDLLTIPYRDFRKGGTHVIKEYLEARRGENYGIVVRNMTPKRVGIVIAVDGRNIISGKKSTLENTEDMYLVNGYGEIRYDGWRTSGVAVHKFYFTETADSYAMRTFGDSSAMGVIAVAVYGEKERPRPLFEGRRDEVAPAPSAGSLAKRRAGAEEQSAGTGFGDEVYSPVVRVAFEPENRPVQKTLIKYEWREVLCKKGILQCRQGTRNRLWDENDYAPYPPGYRGR